MEQNTYIKHNKPSKENKHTALSFLVAEIKREAAGTSVRQEG